jgi:hypothetical protein
VQRDLTQDHLRQEVTVTLPLSAVLRLAEVTASPAPAGAIAAAAAPTGSPREGETFAGLTIHENQPCELYLLPGTFRGPWDKAMAWAKDQGGELPSRIDGIVLFKSLKSEFEDAYYWLGEQLAGDGGCAWRPVLGSQVDRLPSPCGPQATHSVIW